MNRRSGRGVSKSGGARGAGRLAGRSAETGVRLGDRLLGCSALVFGESG